LSDAIRRLLERPGWVRLWPLLREKAERLGGVRGTVVLEAASEEERAAVAGLLGLRELPPETLRLRLGRLDQALRSSRLGVGLEEVLTLQGGPLRDLPAERVRETRRRRELLSAARAHPLLDERPELGAWLDDLEASGLLVRLGRGHEAELLDRAFQVLAALPAEGVPLAVLANEILGSSHALDAGRPEATLVVRALAHTADRAPAGSARERRELWERAGVICDDLTTDVLTLGLELRGSCLLAQTSRAFAAAGEPQRLTLRQLARAELEIEKGIVVHVCENPAIVALAADELGPRSSPLVCTGGFPNAAVRTLLRGLEAAGAELVYHGDFDWPGLQIANTLWGELDLRPWRFGAADYRRAAAGAAEVPKLGGTPAEAVWDAELAPAMAEVGKAIEEEAVAAELLGDLVGGSAGGYHEGS